jgi:hypothetical protein
MGGCGENVYSGIPVWFLAADRYAMTTTYLTSETDLICPDHDLVILDDDDYLYQHNEHLGEIQVMVQSVERFDPVIPKEGGRFNDEVRIHERSKKALATCIRYAQSNSAALFADLASRRFGETKVHAGTPPKNFVARGVKNVCTFVFKYRTMGTPLLLMALSHIVCNCL